MGVCTRNVKNARFTQNNGGILSLPLSRTVENGGKMQKLVGKLATPRDLLHTDHFLTIFSLGQIKLQKKLQKTAVWVCEHIFYGNKNALRYSVKYVNLRESNHTSVFIFPVWKMVGK